VNTRIYFYFYFSFLFYLGLGWSVTSHVTVTVTISYNTEKAVESFRIDNIIQYNKNMLAL